jgi:hypothetical protein
VIASVYPIRRPWANTAPQCGLDAHIDDAFLFVGIFAGTFNIFYQFFIVWFDSGPGTNTAPLPALPFPL